MDRFLRLRHVLERVGMGRSAWFERVADGRAPRPQKIGRIAVWPESQIAAWMRDVIQHGEKPGRYSLPSGTYTPARQGARSTK